MNVMSDRYFVIDLSLFDLHTEKERKRLKLQISQSVYVAKKYKIKDKLILTGVSEKTKNELAGYGIKQKTYSNLKEFLKGVDRKIFLVFDPNASDVFTEGDIENFDVFVVGGIVDTAKDEKKTTEYLSKIFEKQGLKFTRKKVLLRGDIVGVPDRINMFLEMLFKIIYDKLPIEKAIYEAQSRKIARWRLRKELKNFVEVRYENDKKVRMVKKEAFEKIKEWLNIEYKDFEKVAEEQDIKIV